MSNKQKHAEMFSSSESLSDYEPDLQKKSKRSQSNENRFQKKLQLVTHLQSKAKDSILDFLEATEETLDQSNANDQNEIDSSPSKDSNASPTKPNTSNAPLAEIQSFKDEDDFYIQICRSNQKQSPEEAEIIKLVHRRSGKVLSKIAGGLYTILCFKNHVFDANYSLLRSKWCPSCEALKKQVEIFAGSLQGGLVSEFYEPKLRFHCKHYHRWVAPEANILKLKPWCPRCPDVLSLMITHHHRGVSHEMEKIGQIEEQAELIAEGYAETNVKGDEEEEDGQEENEEDEEEDIEARSDLQNLKDLYFILLIDVQLYRKYLQSALPKEADQLAEYQEKKEMFDPKKNQHPLIPEVQLKLANLFAHILPKEEVEEEDEAKSENSSQGEEEDEEQ